MCLLGCASALVSGPARSTASPRSCSRVCSAHRYGRRLFSGSHGGYIRRSRRFRQRGQSLSSRITRRPMAHKRDWQRTCERCGSQFLALRHSLGKFCSKTCAARAAQTPMTIERARRCSDYRGGRQVTPSGYVRIFVGKGHHLANTKGFAYEHRLVAEQTLGRRLTRSEIVHHVNGSKTDNRPENLVIMSQSEHVRLHKPHISRWGETPRRSTLRASSQTA